MNITGKGCCESKVNGSEGGVIKNTNRTRTVGDG